MFSNQFNFERPYVALNGISIEHPYDQIKEYVLSNDVVQVSDIMEIAKEKHYNINSILELCNSFDDTHLMMNSHSLIAITNIGITPEKVSLIENMILNEICGCIPFSWLKCLHALPPISVPWSEWLLYGIIRKWSKKLDVAVSNNQLRLAMPLVAPSGTITKTDLEKYCDSTQDIMENTDNLDNIDDLISDCIEDEMKGWDDF